MKLNNTKLIKKMKRKKGFFSISAVAKMFSIHQQTIRLYEKEGLISPNRSAGNTRLFTEEDVARLEEVIHLTHKLGINLAGVEMILKLQKQIKKMQKEINGLFKKVQTELTETSEEGKSTIKETAQKIARLKKNKEKQPSIESINSESIDSKARKTTIKKIK